MGPPATLSITSLLGGVRNSRAFPSADVGSDHQLIMMNVRLKLKAKKGTIRTRKIDVEVLKNEVIKRTRFQTRIGHSCELLMTEKVEDVEEEWSKVNNIFQETSEKIQNGIQKEKGKRGMDITENSQAHGREKRMQE